LKGGKFVHFHDILERKGEKTLGESTLTLVPTLNEQQCG